MTSQIRGLIRFSMGVVLMLGLGLPTSCATGPGLGGEVGDLGMTLSTTNGDVVYRLRNALFKIGGPDDADSDLTDVYVCTENYDINDPLIFVPLDSGDYGVRLDTGGGGAGGAGGAGDGCPNWFMEYSARGRPFAPIDAVLVSANPVDVRVNTDETTYVYFQFEVDGRLIDFGPGTLAIGIDVTENPPIGGVPDCEELCAAAAGAVLEACLDELPPGGGEAECAVAAQEFLVTCIADKCELLCDDCPAGEVWDPDAGVCTPSESIFDEAQWQITGDGVEPRAGTINTSAPGSTRSVEVFAFPPGSNYSVDMSTTSEDGGLTCAGESIVNVLAGHVTETRLILDCICSTQERLGEVRVGASGGGGGGGSGGGGTCPLLTGGVVSPLQTSVGYAIDLSAIAADAEIDPIEYRWTASGGFVDDPSVMQTVYVCAEEGEHTVTIAVSDDEFEACIDQWTVAVRCVSGDVP